MVTVRKNCIILSIAVYARFKNYYYGQILVLNCGLVKPLRYISGFFVALSYVRAWPIWRHVCLSVCLSRASNASKLMNVWSRCFHWQVAQRLRFFDTNFFSFLQSYGYTTLLCHIFNSAWNNQQQLVIFIHVMVSAGICFDGKERLPFIPDKTKVNAKLYVETLLPELVQECRSVCHLASYFNRTASLHTLQSLLKTGLLTCYQLQWIHW